MRATAAKSAHDKVSHPRNLEPFGEPALLAEPQQLAYRARAFREADVRGKPLSALARGKSLVPLTSP